ncbi:hypothetical protein [Paenibacillus thiaminolyticus]|uniref:hypothetical protein n=1 Tax=Paenibacillus thiaminolyticus TaxID=49283 RepID=UPI00254352E8|nr:hypothetical protein [Paenibacillus thiaminolyticus]WII39943.1 hypothetical protein O0V01_13010 [Paenibacillus thiaminolyticus]
MKDDKTYLHRKITLLNPSKSDAKKIKGKITLFNNKINVGEIPFEKDIIYSKKGLLIDFWIELTDPSIHWNEFHTLIESIYIGNDYIENKIVYGVTLYRTYSFVFSRFNYIKIFGKKILPYEITWLKEQWAWEIWPRFKFLPSSWSSTHRHNKGLFWVRLRKRLYQLFTLLLSSVLLCYSIFSFIIVSSKVIYFCFIAYKETLSNIFT